MVEQPTIQEQAPEAESKKGRAWYFWPLVGLVALVAVFVLGLVIALVVALVTDPDDAANWVGLILSLIHISEPTRPY